MVLAAATCIAVVAYADFGQYAEDLHAKERTTDPDHLVQTPIQNALQANCNVNDALRAGLTGDSKSFRDALEEAENKLKFVASRLSPLVKEHLFRRVVFEKPRQLALPECTIISIRTGDDMLNAIAILAQRSADAIDRIRSGKGRAEDFAEIAENSALISQLILQFYGIATR
jgi:hypothetical protein